MDTKNATHYGLKPTTRWARWDSGKDSPSHLSVTTYVPAFGIASGEMVALRSSFETKLVGSGSPFNMTRWNGHIPPCPRTLNVVGPDSSTRNSGHISRSSGKLW